MGILALKMTPLEQRKPPHPIPLPRSTGGEGIVTATAQTFHRALASIATYQPRGAPFESWLFKIAHNLVVDRYRAGAREASLDHLSDAGWQPSGSRMGNPLESAIQGEQVGAAWAAVALLPPLQRRAVVLRFAHDLSNAEVGARVGRSDRPEFLRAYVPPADTRRAAPAAVAPRRQARHLASRG